MLSNLEIFLIVSALMIFLIVLYVFFKPLFTRKLIQSTIQDSQSMLFQEDPEQGTLGFGNDELALSTQELIILNLISMDKSIFDINQVLMLLKNLNAKHVDGFFSYRDEADNEIFRVASGLNPGLLEIDTETHILFMALDLHQANDPVKALGQMLEAATNIAEKLHASICDQARAPLSKQMIEHYKSKAQEVSHINAMRTIK